MTYWNYYIWNFFYPDLTALQSAGNYYRHDVLVDNKQDQQEQNMHKNQVIDPGFYPEIFLEIFPEIFNEICQIAFLPLSCSIVEMSCNVSWLHLAIMAEKREYALADQRHFKSTDAVKGYQNHNIREITSL